MPSKRVSASKSLGVKIDENLTWHSHDRDVQKHLYWGAVIFGVFRPRFSLWHIHHVVRHGHLTLKRLRLPVLMKWIQTHIQALDYKD